MTPLETLQDYLDVVGKAMMDGDFALFQRHVSLPFQLDTEMATLFVRTTGDLRAGFDNFVSMLRTQRVTDYIRIAKVVEEFDGALISGRYETHILSGGQRVLPPYTTQITLRCDDGQWRAVTMAHPSKNSRWPMVTMQIDDQT